MQYQRFQEYIDAKGKLKEPIVSVDGDTASEGPKTPEPFATKGTGWKDDAALKSKQEPYSGPGTDPGLKATLQPKYDKDSLDSGLLYKGKKDLVYEPGGYNKKDSTRETWPKSKTEQFIADTKGLNTLDFIDRVKVGTGIYPTIKETGHIVSDNPNLMETLVREIKRNGGFVKLMQEVLNHPEAFTQIAFLMENDESACNRLARAIRETTKIAEATDAPAGETEDELDTEEDKKLSHRPPMPPQMTPGGDTQEPSPEMPGEMDMEPTPEMGKLGQKMGLGEMPQRPMMRREHNLVKALQRYNLL